MTLDELNKRFALAGAVAFDKGPGGLTKMILTSPAGSAELTLHGAHMMHFAPAGQRPVLWMSQRSWFEDGKPIRGGVPICFPWFSAAKHMEGAPNHGIVRLRQWDVLSAAKLPDGRVQATLVTLSDENTRAFWPQKYEAKFVVTVGSTLTMALVVTNTDEQPQTITEALHTYFAVSDIHKVQVRGLEDVPFVDTVGGQRRQMPPERRPVTFAAETDRNYLGTAGTCVIEDPAWGRKIAIAKSGSNSTVVWNPWIKKSAAMPDFGDDEWPDMLCVETANAASDAVTIDPGQTHTIEARISVEKL